jgi:L-threonylcarbamoyladenylate synthase
MPIESGEDPAVVDRAAKLIAAGGLVAFATETVYGLGARADDDAAVSAIFSAKGRPRDHPLIVHVADADGAWAFAEPAGGAARRLMQAFWPGPVSLVLRRRAGVADAAAGGLATVALRCPSHPVAQALLRRCRELGVPGIAAPSANRFGRVSPTRARHVQDEFGTQLLILDGGASQAGIESAIIDCSGSSPRLLRPGSLGRAALQDVLDQPLGDPERGSPRVSGSLQSHYAPHAQLVLVPRDELPLQVRALQRHHGEGRVAVWASALPPGVPLPAFLPMPDNAADAAHELFDTLRLWDAQGMQAICVEAPPDGADWDGVRDRLQRAAAPR